jgi:hypothetical protein
MNTKTSRRRFFTAGGAALGAGVATTVGASALSSDDIARDQLACAEDREAIRRLHLAFMGFVEQRAIDAAAELFDEPDAGKGTIWQFVAGHDNAVFHRAYRQNASQQQDAVSISANRLQASGLFHVEAQLCTPLADDCTAAKMARLQGNVADLRWETGRFEATYVKTRGEWKIASLTYRAA